MLIKFHDVLLIEEHTYAGYFQHRFIYFQ